jgi:hypothetical protein
MPERVDDLSIPDDEPLWRRILPDWLCPIEDGGFRPSSAAFLDNRSGEVSVHVASLTTAELVLRDRPGEGIAEILAHVPRSLGHAIVRDPTEQDRSHALICPPVGRGRGRRKQDARLMAGQARWVVQPPADGRGPG